MDPRTKSILEDIEKMKTENDTEMLETMKDYWDGFRDGVNIVLEVLDKLKNDMVVPVEEALKDV
jgi:hypothetical protein